MNEDIKIKNIFNYVFATVLFLPVVFESLFKKTELNPEAISNVFLSFSVVIGLIILDYLFLENTKKWAHKIIPSAISYSLQSMLFVSAIIFLMLSGFINKDELSGYLFLPFAFSLHLLEFLPILIFVLLLINKIPKK